MSAPGLNGLTGNRIEFRQVQGRRVVRRHWGSVARESWLGASRDAELAAHRVGSRFGIAPQITAVDLAARWMEIEWLKGVPIVLDELATSSSRSMLWTLLDQLRRLDASDVPRLDVSSRIDELLHRLSRIDSTACLIWRSQWLALRARSEEHAAEEGVASPFSRCLVHGDLHSGNVLHGPGERFVCIDWEYAHAGHPLEDLAGLLNASSVLQAEWQTAQHVTAPRPDWWPETVFDALGCRGHADRVRRLGWWIEARGILDGVWMALASHSAGNAPDA